MAETAKKIVRALLNSRIMLPIFAWVICVGFCVIVVCFTIRTFRPQKIRNLKSVEITVVDTKGKAKDLSAEGKAHVKEQMHTALMEVSGKAEAAYNEKFATLLTILTLFGVAWPIVVSYLQKMSLERDRAEIAEANKKAEDTYQNNLSIMSEIQSQRKEIANQKEEIKDLQRNSYMQFAVLYVKYVRDYGFVLNTKRKNRQEQPSGNWPPESLTKAFSILVQCVDAFSEAELIIPSKDTHNSDSLIGIMETSNMAYNLVWNYGNIIYNDEIASELNKCISNIEKMDHNLYQVTQSLQNLTKVKELLETVCATQNNTSQPKNKD